jgi:hypothetical protein
MSWLFSQALVAEFSAERCSGGELSAQSNATHTPQAYLSPDKTTDTCPRFPSGTTCEHLTDDRGQELLTWFLAASRAKTSALPERKLASVVSDPGYGPRWSALLRKFDRRSYSWKTHRCLFSEALPLWSLTLPPWGSMRRGELFRRNPPAHRTNEKDSGLWATTPTRLMPLETTSPDESRLSKIGRKIAKSGIEGSANWCQNVLQLGLLPTAELCEFYLGWPIGWTDLRPLETDKFQRWLASHGASYQGALNDE